MMKVPLQKFGVDEFYMYVIGMYVGNDKQADSNC